MLKSMQYALAAILAVGPVAGSAYTRDDHLAWLKENQAATPQFAAGDTITYDNADLIRPFIPKEQQDSLIFEGMEMKIVAPTDLTPRADYLEATKKFAGQAGLAADGALENYTAGRPFDPEKFVAGSAEDGWRAIWNYMFRWQHAGVSVADVQWVWVRPGGTHENHEAVTADGGKFKDNYLGGGGFERLLRGPYQRVLMSHRSDLPASDYKFNEGKGFAKNTNFREYTGFVSPFDIAGTAFLILRYDDPRKADDSWAYIPSLRRVRRISVEVKSDSLLGTDHTLEDFYGFNGRPMEHTWIHMGDARILAINSSRNVTAVYYGPNGWSMLDDWQLRDYWVLNQIPVDSGHPYGEKFLYNEKQTGMSFFANAFDKAGELWKTWQMSKNWTEDPAYSETEQTYGGKPTPPGVRVPSFQSINVIDHQNGRGTLVPCFGNSYPFPEFKKVKRTMDVNYLTEGR
ncbi:MAG: hypothetical protein ACI9BW_000032 [Gammaproteobacteria bacterium]|jgi:hypothetical protein